MSEVAESVLVCEGFHDRAFLTGWLLAHGWESWKDKIYAPHRRVVRSQGEFAFHAQPASWLRVVPAFGESNVRSTALTQLESAKTRMIRHIVAIWDDDSEGDVLGARTERFVAWAAKVPGATRRQQDNEFDVATLMQTRLSAIVLSASDAQVEHLPQKQTLERLACAAIADAYPARAPHVAAWLRARPGPPVAEQMHKSHAASHMAGWFSDHGYEDFFRALFGDAMIRAAIERRLNESGAARILETLSASSL